MRLILASSSPRRKELLESLNLNFEIITEDTSEDFDINKSIYDNVKLLGLKKALAVFNQHPDSVVLGCDTIVVLYDKVYGKPKDKEDAFKMLKAFSGKTHQVLSGVGIISSTKVFNFVVSSDVTFKELSDQDILDYIETGECFGKAGSYAIQGIGNKLVKKYEGELNNIIGLPTKEVSECLEELL